ncbi:hypothetical protein KZZ05_08650 [Marinobacter adhaerens]|uniref:hypothetical protein n=1 Tax=Marinobacter adhaerens TaxID=1033846 RepID=UPI001C5D81DA|nr:hypothetical protein [Marinobacter adhaerens]MBW4978342.1 hypothetical protein [Marinobacter adhaerens]
MTVRDVSMELTFPQDATGVKIDALVVVSGLQQEVNKVYDVLFSSTSINFTFEDYDGVEVYFIFHLYGGGYQPQVHGPYTVTDFGAA